MFFKLTQKNPKRRKAGNKRKPGFDENILKETEYYIKDGSYFSTVSELKKETCHEGITLKINVTIGLRYVKPYPFTFTTYCKGRWLRRKLIDVLSQEFQSETAEYYVRFE